MPNAPETETDALPILTLHADCGTMKCTHSENSLASVQGHGMKVKRTLLLAACALVAYIAILIKFIVFKSIPIIRIGHLRFKFAHPHTGPGNFVPFKTMGPQLIGRGNHLIDMVNLMGNIIPLMPVGLLAPLVFQSISWLKALVLGVLTGLSFEVMEVVFRVGIFDVDDVILNAFGVMVGYGAWVMFKSRTQPRLG
jgi:glycopeptide antibiotics resistance protein